MSDHPECCTVCGCTLEYLLTQTGQDAELHHFDENPVSPDEDVNGEFTYALTRIFMNLDQPGADPGKVASALKIAEDTLAAIKNGRDSTPPDPSSQKKTKCGRRTAVRGP